jgi:hypothetical protein
LPKSERLCKVKPNKGILLLPAEHSAPDSLEECHGVFAMTMYCQLDGLMLDSGVVITPPRLPGETMVDRTYVLSISNVGVNISAPTNPSLVAGRRTRCSNL